MKYCIDTEFNDLGHNKIDLLSVGICAEDGRKYYAAVKDADWKAVHANAWLRDNVVPVLSAPGTNVVPYRTRAEIKDEIKNFLRRDPQPEFWAYFADWDWILFCHIFGTLLEVNHHIKGAPMLCLDIKQEMLRLRIPKSAVSSQLTPEHNALNDAEWNMQILREVGLREKRQYGSTWIETSTFRLG